MPNTPEENKRFVIQHFAEFVNNKDLDAIDRNMTLTSWITTDREESQQIVQETAG